MPQIFQQLFTNQIYELISAEQQIHEILPRVIHVTSSGSLREAFERYKHEIEQHENHLHQITREIGISPIEQQCRPVAGIVSEINSVMANGGNSAVKDAALIAMIQRLQHYKMAIYGTARTFARHLNYHKALDLLQRSLNEEGAADHHLTRLAEGGVFSTGINEEAYREKAPA